MKTVVTKLIEVTRDIEAARDSLGTSNGPAAREFSIAITALEDATMRVNRGFAKTKGTFFISDVEGS